MARLRNFLRVKHTAQLLDTNAEYRDYEIPQIQ